MIIVAGHLLIGPEHRDAFLERCRDAITAARSSEGCLDYHLSADPIEPDRINIFERWESSLAVEQFRGSGPDDEQMADVRGADVHQFEIAGSTSLT